MDFDMRTIHIRAEIEDSDFSEYQLETALKGLLGDSMKDFKRLIDTSDLYENDQAFRHIYTKKKATDRAYYDYINNKKLKK